MDRTATQLQPTPSAAAAPDSLHSRIRGWLAALLLALVTLGLYWPATRHDFVRYDDPDYVTSNVHVQHGLTAENVKWAFVNPVSSNWHPLTMLSHMLDWRWYGMNPWGHHLTSVLLHALNAALVFLMLRDLTGAFWRSLLVAALFAVHPLRVESVAWVAERKDVLSGAFGLLTLIFYSRFARRRAGVETPSSEARATRRAKIHYGLALLCLSLGLLCKPMLVTWPFVMLLLDYWPLGRFDTSGVWPLAREKIPFFALAGAASVVTFLVQKQSGAVQSAEMLPLTARAGNALISYCRYCGKMVWPADLAVFYPHPGYWPLGWVLLAGSLLSAISAFLWVRRRSYPFSLMGWLWFLGTLVPVIGLVQAGLQSMADRYTYLPSIGMLLGIVWGAYEVSRRWRYGVTGILVAGAIAILLCLALTRRQLGYWQNTESLFRHACAVTKNNYLARYNLARALEQNGQIDEAVSEYQAALRLMPDRAEVHFSLALALVLKGKADPAIPEFEAALRLKPDYREAHYHFGLTLARKGQIDEAIGQFEAALRLQPEDADAHYNLALALALKGELNDAIPQYQAALRLKPEDAEACYSLALALDQSGRSSEAIPQYQAAIRLQPENAGARNNLGVLWAGGGENLEQASALILKTVQLEPKNAAFLDSLAWVLLKQNRPREALDYQRQAIENSRPPGAALYDHLGNIYSALKRNDLAADAWRKAMSIEPDPKIQEKLDLGADSTTKGSKNGKE